jgi:hypothetical protein
MPRTQVRYWYVADGDALRHYDDVFLRFGVMLIGPGDHGDYFKNKAEYHDDSYVCKFAEELKPEHIIILKKGTKRIVAAGTIDKRQDSYHHFEVFGDVDGFSLQHGRFVTWHKPRGQRVLKRLLPRDRLCECHDLGVQKMAERIISENKAEPKDTIPNPAKKVDDEELIHRLIEKGLSSAQSEDVVSAFRRVRRVGKWFNEKGESVSEHETRTFLIIPLLLALGWPEQRLKIEWKNLDIAFFASNYANKSEPELILESKRLDEPLMFAVDQIKEYAQDFPNCTKLIVSNGIVYHLYEKNMKDWRFQSYLNLLDLRERHPYLPEVQGAPSLLTTLLP